VFYWSTDLNTSPVKVIYYLYSCFLYFTILYQLQMVMWLTVINIILHTLLVHSHTFVILSYPRNSAPFMEKEGSLPCPPLNFVIWARSIHSKFGGLVWNLFRLLCGGKVVSSQKPANLKHHPLSAIWYLLFKTFQFLSYPAPLEALSYSSLPWIIVSYVTEVDRSY
jgi:hypothetical protein